MPTMGVDGRCYSQDGRWISHWVNVLILNLRFCVRPHPICKVDGTFRDGSLTLVNRASFIALVRFWSSLPIMVKLLMVTS